MPSTDEATGKFVSVRTHYDRLVDEGDDPTLDPPELAAYMDGWDGEALFEELRLTGTCRVLEIGVGTGRLAVRTLRRGCKSFAGMDLSEKAIEVARGHLDGMGDARLICGAFPQEKPDGPFDRIYSSLTFLHIRDKRAAVSAAAALLADGGRMVLSLDKSRERILDMGTRAVETYPDDPEHICALMRAQGLRTQPVREIERAWLAVGERVR